MSDPIPPDDAPDRDSIPLLLARPGTGEIQRAVMRAREAAAPPPPLGGVRWAARGVLASRFGAAGLLVVALLALVAVFAEMLASDLPIACKVHGQVYMFPNVTRPLDLAARDATTIAREADWSIGAVVAHGTGRGGPKLASPGGGHPFGTDREGRDVFARVVHGTRSYLAFALAAVGASIALGALFGALAGLFGGATDAILGRAIESISAFPPLVLVIGIQAALPRPTILTLFLAIALTRWPEVARLVRGEVLLASTRDYALAARALGASPFRILRRHIMPNVRGPLVIAATVGVSAVVLTEASLDFLHVGVPGDAASWGETMSEFRDASHAWWLLLFPGVLLVATVFAHTLVGESFREAFDPRSRT